MKDDSESNARRRQRWLSSVSLDVDATRRFPASSADLRRPLPHAAGASCRRSIDRRRARTFSASCASTAMRSIAFRRRFASAAPPRG